MQFASGVVLKSDRLYVSYGVADCHAAFAEIPQFYSNSEFWVSALLSQFPAPMLTSTRTKVCTNYTRNDTRQGKSTFEYAVLFDVDPVRCQTVVLMLLIASAQYRVINLSSSGMVWRIDAGMCLAEKASLMCCMLACRYGGRALLQTTPPLLS